MRRIAVLFSLAVLAMPANADQTPTDKSQYSLLNPTPRELWRPMSADRPDFTESPFTVDAGAVQLELSFVDYTKNGEEEAWTVAHVYRVHAPRAGLVMRRHVECPG